LILHTVSGNLRVHFNLETISCIYKPHDSVLSFVVTKMDAR